MGFKLMERSIAELYSFVSSKFRNICYLMKVSGPDLTFVDYVFTFGKDS